jgi:acetyl-CoA synthetase
MAEAEIKWFVDAKSILLKTVLTDIAKEQNGYHFEPNDPSEEAIHISYTELHHKFQMANVLRDQGYKKEIEYVFTMIPELAIATLACARIEPSTRLFCWIFSLGRSH